MAEHSPVTSGKATTSGTGFASSKITVISTSSVSVPPLPSSTVRVITNSPPPRLTVGFTPVTVPKGPLHEYVSGSPSGSEEAEPSNVTSTVPTTQSKSWSSPALAIGA